MEQPALATDTSSANSSFAAISSIDTLTTDTPSVDTSFTDISSASTGTTDFWELPFCRLHLAEFSRVLPTAAANHSSSAMANNVSAAVRLAEFSDSSEFAGSTFAWFRILLPLICAFGISGNLLNIVVLTRKRFVAPMHTLEKCANLGLIALAVSDLLFCLVALPHGFVDRLQPPTTTDRSALSLYYKVYGISLVNLLLMSSTWLIVAMAVDRYTVLYYPLRAKLVMSLRRSKTVIASIYGACCALTLPYFLHKQVRRCSGLDGVARHEIWTRDVDLVADWSFVLQVYIRHVWPVIAVFLPQLLLFACNVRLVHGLHTVAAHRRRKCPGQSPRDVSNRITLTLVIIVAMAIILVAPAELMKAFDPYTLWGRRGYVIASVANLLQTLNFAINFALYCVIDRHFRHICRALFFGCCSAADASPTSAERDKQPPGTPPSERLALEEIP